MLKYAPSKCPCALPCYLLYYLKHSFSFMAVSYDTASILNSWKQVYLIYFGRASSDAFFIPASNESSVVLQTNLWLV